MTFDLWNKLLTRNYKTKKEWHVRKFLYKHLLNLACLWSRARKKKQKTRNISCCQTTRSSRSEVFCKKGVLRYFARFTGKHLCQSLFFNKVAGLRLWIYSKKITFLFFDMRWIKFLREEHSNYTKKMFIFKYFCPLVSVSSRFWAGQCVIYTMFAKG